jgi:MscS family membrane protein
VGVRYDDMASVGKIVKSVRAYLGKNTDIDQKQVTIVNLDNFGASTVDILVYCLTKTKDWVEFHEVKQKVMLDVAGIIEKHGAEIAFPTSTLHVPEAINILSENTAKKGAKKKAS